MTQTATETYTDHPLLQTRTARPGFRVYVHTDADIDEMVGTIWAPEVPMSDGIRAAASACIAVVGQSRWSDAVSRYTTRSKPTLGHVAQVEAEQSRTRRARLTSRTCRHCGGPVADGAGDCGECR